jgi:hypothetical protein
MMTAIASTIHFSSIFAPFVRKQKKDLSRGQGLLSDGSAKGLVSRDGPEPWNQTRDISAAPVVDSHARNYSPFGQEQDSRIGWRRQVRLFPGDGSRAVSSCGRLVSKSPDCNDLHSSVSLQDIDQKKTRMFKYKEFS